MRIKRGIEETLLEQPCHDVNGQESTSQVVKNSAVISAFNVLGFASALLIDVIVAARFGLSQDVDAFFIAFTIPKLVSSILLVAFNAVLVPVFTKAIIEEGKSLLWRISSNLANFSLLGLGLLGIVGSASSPLLIRILGAGFNDSARELAISLGSYLFLTIIPVGAVEVLKATLNSLRSFALPAATALVRNSIIVSMVFLSSRRLGIYSLVAGHMLAAWLQLAFLGIGLLIQGFQYQPILQWREAHTVETFKQMRYPLTGTVLEQSSILVERFLASFLPSGLVTALAYARRLYGAMDRIFLGSISTAFLPRLSSQSARDRLPEFKRTLSLALKLSTLIAAPATVGIVTLSVPIVGLLFGRGAFDQDAIHTIAGLLRLYVIGVLAMALFRVVQASYYACGDTKTPFYIRILILGFNVVFDFILFFALGAAGLASATTLSQVIVTVFAAWLLYRRVGALDPGVATFAAKVGLAAVLMGGIVFGLQKVLLVNSGSGYLLDVAFWSASGAGVYVLLLLVFRVEEIKQMASIVRTRLYPQESSKLTD